MNTITLFATSLTEYAKMLRSLKALPVSVVESYITGGTWTDTKDGETVFVREGRCQIAKAGRKAVTIVVNGDEYSTVTPDSPYGKYAVVIASNGKR